MKVFKKILGCALAASLAFTAFGCGGGSNNGGTNDFVVQIFSGGYGSEMWSYALKEFEKDHPEYNVQINMSNYVNDAMADDWKDGNEPDFVFLDGELEKQAWLESGLLYDFTDWAKTAKVAGEDVTVAQKVNMEYAFKYTDKKGKTITYGMPLLVSSYGTWYDNALFTKNGWTVPENYAQLKEFTQNSATKDMATLIYPGGNAAGYLVQGFILPALAEYGQEFYNRVENALDAEVYTSENFKAVMNRFAEFCKLTNAFKKGSDGIVESLSVNHTQSQIKWLNHEAAFIPNGLWLRKELEKDIADPKNGSSVTSLAGFEMRYTSSPLTLEKKVIIASSVTCGVAKNAKNQKAALEFITYLYRDDVIKKFVERSDSPSAATVDLSDVVVSDVLKYTQQVMNDSSYTFYNHTGSWGDVDSVFNQGVNSIVNGTKTVDEVCNEIAAQARKQLSGK